jgi:hypothetical protein
MENYWRGFIASAEYSWSPKGRTLEEYDKAWLQKEFGLEMPDYLSFFASLRSGSSLWYEAYNIRGGRLDEENSLRSLQRVEHWLPALEGQEKICFDYTSKLIDLPDINNPGDWSKKHKAKLDRAMTELANHEKTVEKLRSIHDSALRNRYYWELSAALYNLQYTAPKILLALQECDSEDKNQRQAGLDKVKLAIIDFNKAWAELQSVYSETRFVAYPACYIPDRYFHVASQSEDLSWMIQPEILYFGMIEKWLQSQPQ